MAAHAECSASTKRNTRGLLTRLSREAGTAAIRSKPPLNWRRRDAYRGTAPLPLSSLSLFSSSVEIM
jgi:hypothetical protein